VWTMQAIDPTHLVFNSAGNRGDWRWSGSGNQARAYSNYGHGELFVIGSDHSGASFNGTVDGTTLSVNAMQSGSLAVGQYVTAQTGSGLAFPAGTRIVAGQGTTWQLNQAVGNASGNMVSQYRAVAIISVGLWWHNRALYCRHLEQRRALQRQQRIN